jgi:hypothetical protein
VGASLGEGGVNMPLYGRHISFTLGVTVKFSWRKIFNLLAKRPRKFHLQNAHEPPARPSLPYSNSVRVLFISSPSLARAGADEESISVKTHFWLGEEGCLWLLHGSRLADAELSSFWRF